jgi:hypothetical protein
MPLQRHEIFDISWPTFLNILQVMSPPGTHSIGLEEYPDAIVNLFI